MGYAFGYYVARVQAGSKVGAYVHYPTVSTDMIGQVKGLPKTLYYHTFAWLYGLMGRAADVVMVNSSWTEAHIKHLWGITNKYYRPTQSNVSVGLTILYRTRVVFPPCDTTQFEATDLAPQAREDLIVSLGSAHDYCQEMVADLQKKKANLGKKRITNCSYEPLPSSWQDQAFRGIVGWMLSGWSSLVVAEMPTL